MWSTACSIFEMYTGKLLFTGRSNNEMLKQMMQLKGPIVSKVLRKSEYASQHFDLSNNNFLSYEIDSITKQEIIKNIPIGKVKTKDLESELGLDKNGNNNKNLTLLKELLDKCLNLDPEKR